MTVDGHESTIGNIGPEGYDGVYVSNGVHVAWARKPGKKTGPDAILTGFTGGNHCATDVIVVAAERDPPVEVLRDCVEEFKLDNQGPEFDLNLELMVAGLPMIAASVKLPLLWNDSTHSFELDFSHLLAPAPDDSRRRNIQRSISEEITGFPAGYSFEDALDFNAAKTQQAMANLIYSGNADVAAAILHEAWPKSIVGREAYWKDFAKQVVSDATWNRFGLARLRNSSVLTEAAAQK